MASPARRPRRRRRLRAHPRLILQRRRPSSSFKASSAAVLLELPSPCRLAAVPRPRPHSAAPAASRDLHNLLPNLLRLASAGSEQHRTSRTVPFLSSLPSVFF
ncbi:hypothetical protein VPH35_110486 [Triticum aestivum]